MTDAAVMVLVLLVLFALLTPSCGSARETGRQNTCRDNLRRLAIATLAYENLYGHFPGYMNARETDDGRPHPDPDSEPAQPVSWVVEILTHVDADKAYDQWPATIATSTPTATATPTATGAATPTATPSSTAMFPKPIERKDYLELLVCPSRPNPSRLGPQLTYAVNSGMPDLPRAIPPQADLSGAPRDWPANGIFFDRYAESKQIRGNDAPAAPMVTMRRSMIADPKDKTILLAENLDVGQYAFDRKDFPNGDPLQAEKAWGIVWGPGEIKAPSTMLPPDDLLSINTELRHGRRTTYRYSRPSSLHPQGVNIALVGVNVVFIRETTSYFVWAKLMASDDTNTKLPGNLIPLDSRFRDYHVNDADLNP